MSSEHAAAAAALIRTVFAEHLGRVLPAPSALGETTESVTLQIEAGGGACVDGGCGLAGVVLWAPRDGALYVGRLAVDPRWRRRGVARALLAAAEDEARRRGLPRLSLGTRLALTDNRRLFTQCGFVEVAQHAHDGFAAPTWVEMEKPLG